MTGAGVVSVVAETGVNAVAGSMPPCGTAGCAVGCAVGCELVDDAAGAAGFRRTP
ncbi:hypothetical protein ACFQV8_34155 [Pseudonocardia benzenivorans]